MIIHCVKMRKVESINFRFGGRSTTFCSSGHAHLAIVFKQQTILFFVDMEHTGHGMEMEMRVAKGVVLQN